MCLPLPSFDVTAELGTAVGNVRSNGSFGAVELSGHFFGGESFHVAQQERGPLARAQKAQAVFQVVPLFGPQEQLFRALRMTLRSLVELAERPPAPPQEIDRRIGGDPRQPVRGLLIVFELFLVLER